jgi:hypothetical protein
MAGLARRIIDGFLPGGEIWRFRKDGNIDKLLDGIGASFDSIIAKAAQVADYRNPNNVVSELVPDMLRELGLTSTDNEDADRTIMSEIRYNDWGVGFVARLQEQLDKAGFGSGGYGLTAVQNAPFPVLPFLAAPQSFPVTASAQNGLFPLTASAKLGSGAQRLFPLTARHQYFSYSGYYFLDGSHIYLPDNLSIPPQATWGLIPFIGGEIQRDQTGKITAVPALRIPAALRLKLHSLLCRVKPVPVWLFIAVLWV